MNEQNRLAETTDDLKEDPPSGTNDTKRIRKRVLTIFFILFNIAVISTTAVIDFSKEGLPAALLGVNLVFLFAAAGCFLVALAALTVDHFVLQKGLNHAASVRLAFETAVLGKYYDFITPTGAGGQPFQVYYLLKNGVSTGASAAIPITAFLSQQLAFIVLAIIVFAFGNPYLSNVHSYTIAIKVSAYIGVVFYAALPLLVVFFAIFPRAAGAILHFIFYALKKLRLIKNPDKILTKALTSFTEYRENILSVWNNKPLLLKTFGLGLLFQIAMCSIPYFILRAFGSPLIFRSVFSMMIMIYCAITYIPTPGNAGVAEASFYALLATLNQGYLFWAMLIWRFLSYYVFLGMGGGIFAFNTIEKRWSSKNNNQSGKKRNRRVPTQSQ